MKVILLQDVEGLGEANDIVPVKNGYGRNYLIPKRLAIVANKANEAKAAELARQSIRKRDKMLSTYRSAAAKLEVATIKVGAKVGSSGKIFGSVTNIQLSDAIKANIGLDIDRKTITILDEIKALGSYKAEIDLHPEVKPTIEFEVVAD